LYSFNKENALIFVEIFIYADTYMNKAPYNLKSDTEVSLPASVIMAIFIYSIANTLNNKKTAKAADSIIYYSMLNRKPGKEN